MASRKPPEREPRPSDKGGKPPERGPKPPRSPDAKPGSNPDKKTPPEKGSVLEFSTEAIGTIKNLLGPDTQTFEATAAELKKSDLDRATLEKFHAQFADLLQQGNQALETLKRELAAIEMDADLKELAGDGPLSGQVKELEMALKELRKVTIGIKLRHETKKAEEEEQQEREVGKEIDKKERETFTLGLKRSGILAEDVLQALNEIDRSTVTDFVVKKAGEREFSPAATQLIEEANRFYEEDLANIRKDREKLRTNFKRSDQLAQWEEILSNPDKVTQLKKRGVYEKALEKVASQFETEFEPVRVAAEKNFAGFEEAALNARNENILRAVLQEITMDEVGEILATPDFHLGAVADNLANIFYAKKDKRDILSARSSLHLPAGVTQGLLGKFSDRSIEKIVDLKLGVFYTEPFGQELERRGMVSSTQNQDTAVRKKLAQTTKFIEQKFIDAKKDASEINSTIKILQEGKKVAEGQERAESLQKIQAELEKNNDIPQLEALKQRADSFELQVQQVQAQVEQKFTEVRDMVAGIPPLPEVQAVFAQDSQDYKKYLLELAPEVRQLTDAVAEVKQKIEAKLTPLSQSAEARDTAQKEEKVAAMYEVRKQFQTAQHELTSLNTDLHSLESRIHYNKELLAQIVDARAFNMESEMSIFGGARLHVVTFDNQTKIVYGNRNERRKISEEMSGLEKQLKNEIKELEAQIEPRKQRFEKLLDPLENGVRVAVRQLEVKGVGAPEREAFQEIANTLIKQFKGDLHKIHSHEKAEVDALYKKLKLLAEIAKGGKDRAVKQEDLRKLEVAESEDTKRENLSMVIDFQNSPDAKRKEVLAELESHSHHLQEAMDRLDYTPTLEGTPRRAVMDLTASQDAIRVVHENRRFTFEKTFEKVVQGVADEVKAFESLGEETTEQIEKYRQVVKDIDKIQKSNVMVEIPFLGTAVLQEVTLDDGIISHKKGTKNMRMEIRTRMENLKNRVTSELGKDGLVARFEQERTRMLGKVEALITKLERTLTDMEREHIQPSEYQKFKNQSLVEINQLKEKVKRVGMKEKEAKPAKPHSGGHH